MILLIDNYDSFSYNLYQLIGTLNPDIRVIRNDEMTVDEIAKLKPQAIILSPGPGHPADAGVCIEVVKRLGEKIPILGVCLGHQAICEAYGATVTYAKKLMHGKQSNAKADTATKLFKGMDEIQPVARYHSLAADEATMPSCLKITAASDGEIMAVQHVKYPVYGVQFHPESILTPNGKQIIQNFLGGSKMIQQAIKKLVNRENLSYEEANTVMDEIMSGETTQIQTAAFLTAMSMKGETIEEITACAAGMRAHCEKLLNDMDVLEIVGTGGDGSNSFNISTTSAIVAAAGGVPVAKHGNRAASSKCGTADCFEALGVNITVSPEKSSQLLKKIGICFLFAQNYHLSMKYVAPVRRELGIRTVFNILGPLTNPAGASMQLMGVYDEALVKPLAEVLQKLGVKRGMVVYGKDKLDEISLSAPTTVCEFGIDGIKNYEINPQDFGFELCDKSELVGGTPAENAKITREILNGTQGAKRNAVLLNAGAALYIAGKADTMANGVKLAADIIDSGKAAEKLDEFVKYSNEE